MQFSWYRLYAYALRHLRPQFRDVGRILDIIVWPFIDMLIFGFMGYFVARTETAYMSLSWIPIIGVLCWQVIAKAHLEIALNLYEELASKNLLNLMTSPLLLSEWLMASMLLGIIRGTFVLLLWGTMAWFFYGVNIFMFGWYLVPMMGMLFLSGWTLGCIAASMIIRYGAQLLRLIFVIGWCLTPFCGVYYPSASLPSWAQSIGMMLPMTYTFKAIHTYMRTGIFGWKFCAISFGLGTCFLVGSIILFHLMLKKSKKLGLSRLEVD